MNVVFSPSKKGKGGGSGSRLRPRSLEMLNPLEVEQNSKDEF